MRPSSVCEMRIIELAIFEHGNCAFVLNTHGPSPAPVYAPLSAADTEISSNCKHAREGNQMLSPSIPYISRSLFVARSKYDPDLAEIS